MAQSVAATHSVDDCTLLARHVAGDRSAFAELLTRYRGSVYGYLVRCGIPASARDDLIQDAFLRVHRAAPRFEPRRPLRVWLFTIVANTVRSYFRRARITREHTCDVEATSREADGLALTEARELETFLGRCLADLPLVQREVIALTCTGGMMDQDAATILGLPVNTVKTYRRRARLHLARALARRQQNAQRELGESFSAS